MISWLSITIPDCGDCCCPADDAVIQITVADVTICGCLSNGGGVAPSVRWTATLDGVYTFGSPDTSPDLKVWQVSVPAQLDAYSTTACGTLANTFTGSIVLFLVCYKGALSVRAVSTLQSGLTVAFGRLPYFILTDTFTMGDMADNLLTTCDTVFTDPPENPFDSVPFTSGRGGTVLVEIIPP